MCVGWCVQHIVTFSIQKSPPNIQKWPQSAAVVAREIHLPLLHFRNREPDSTSQFLWSEYLLTKTQVSSLQSCDHKHCYCCMKQMWLSIVIYAVDVCMYLLHRNSLKWPQHALQLSSNPWPRSRLVWLQVTLNVIWYFWRNRTFLNFASSWKSATICGEVQSKAILRRNPWFFVIHFVKDYLFTQNQSSHLELLSNAVTASVNG